MFPDSKTYQNREALIESSTIPIGQPLGLEGQNQFNSD